MVLPSAQNSDVKKRSSIRLPFIVASILSFLITTHIVSARTPRVLPYQDESLSIEKRVRDRSIERARAAAGETFFETARTEGRAMSSAQAIAFVQEWAS
jgi:hypothetical protein